MREPFFILMICVFSVEGLIYFIYPSLLAWIAFIPLKLSRIVELPPEFMGEMPDDNSAGYRQPAKSSVDLSKLTWPRNMSFDDSLGDYSEKGGFCWLRLKYTWIGRKPLGIVKIRALPIEGNVKLAVSCYPYPMGMVLILFWFLLPTEFGISAAFGNLSFLFTGIVFMIAVLAFNFFWGLRRMKDQTTLALEVIADSFCNNTPK